MLWVRLIFLRVRSELGLLCPRSGILPLVSITGVSRLNIEPKDPQEVRLALVHVLIRERLHAFISVLSLLRVGNMHICQGSGGVL